MATLQQLLDQKAELERQIEATRRNERGEAIARIKALMSEQGLTLADISAKAAAPRSNNSGTGRTSGSKVAAKYRNSATGESWSGRGLQPKWLKAALASGRKIEEFAV